MYACTITPARTQAAADHLQAGEALEMRSSGRGVCAWNFEFEMNYVSPTPTDFEFEMN
jgi:hypothetical protein